MQEIKVYINSDDIINKLSEKDKQIYDKCIFKGVHFSEEAGSVEISCILTNQQVIDSKYRYHLGQGEINLIG